MKETKIKKISKIMSFLLFFGLLVILPILTVVLPKEKFSETENRNLASLPKFSVENVFNRKYMNGLETFLSDHFIGRTTWIKGKTVFELMEGKKESNGVFVVKGRLLQKLPTPNDKEIEKSITAINNFAAENGIPTYLMLAPTSTGVYPEKLPKNAPTYSQKEFIESCYKKLSENVVPLDAFSAMNASKSEYIYYRTDHHWTTLGAYYAYVSTIKKMGYMPTPLSKFDIEHASDEFLGTLYSKALYDGVPADTLDIYHYNSGVKVTSVEVNTGLGIETYDSMYFREYLDKKDKYSTFCGSNQPIVTIKTDLPTENKLVIFKDSYAHCYVPFLTQHYSEITMVDMRYINTSYRDVIDIESYDQALFLYNAATFAEEANIKKLDF